MNILILGSGGREHALALLYSKSKNTQRIFVLPGNGLTDFQNKKVQTVPNIDILDFDKILKLARREKIELVDVAQDSVLAAGFVDKFTKEGINAFGPTQKAAEIEWNKEWSRNFMVKNNLPIPHFKSFTNQKEALAYITKLPEQLLFIKASGLALGKGVIRAENKQQAREAIAKMTGFGKSGETFLIEEGLIGEEFSFFAICDGENYVLVNAAQDHKTVFEGDQGPNTGGMGCVAPISIVNEKVKKEVEIKIMQPFMKGMITESRPYSGILYLGGMITHSASSGQAQVKIIEFNARWGDPEAEVILPAIKTDYLDLVYTVLQKKLSKKKILFDQKIRISIVGAARGYPTDYSSVNGKEVFGLLNASKLPGITIYGAGIATKGKRFFVHGGRVFHLVAEGNTIEDARKKVYAAMSLLFIEGNNLHYRTDIGWREVERLVKK